MKKLSRDMKTVVIMLIVFGVIILAYIVQDIYFSGAGKVETEYITQTEEKEVVSVSGFVVRDENRTGKRLDREVNLRQNERTHVPFLAAAQRRTQRPSFRRKSHQPSFRQ